jgi:Golgi apparatus protein 1
MKAITVVTLCLLTKCATTLESLATNGACRQDYEAIKDTCVVPAVHRGKSEDIWSVLACLQSPPGDTQISQACDSLLWEVKLNMTSQEGFLMKASKMCTDEINDLRMCETDRISPAHFVSCLVQNKHATKNPGCRIFLDRIESLIFSDFRLVGNFTNACKNDVKKFQCGRTGPMQNQPHSQGKTMACLEERVQELEPNCKSEIFQMAELQGERVDYDKALFGSCQEEINRFCSGLTAGQQGLVYDCLMSNKLSPGMSQQCSKHITRRQRLTSLDYKVSVSLATKCECELLG